jgi:EmrB/QacA subfamily drug resistance transporter
VSGILTTGAGRHRKRNRRMALWAVVVTGLAGFMAMLDNLVVITALPSIAKHLGGGIEKLEWTMSAYTLTFSVFMLLGAAAGDRFGRRRVFIAGLALFTAASAAAALAPNANDLIVARAVQGLGAAIVMPLTLTLLTKAVPPGFRGMALGVWSAANGLAVAIGPVIGGAVVVHLTWQWIFWFNVPVGALLIPLARWKLAESRGPAARLDIVGTVLVSLGLFGIVYAIIRSNEDSWTSPVILGGLAGGSVLVAAFAMWESRIPYPMLPMRMFRNTAFNAVNVASLLMALGMFGAIFLLTQFFQNIQGFDALQAGARMLPWTAMPIVVAPLAGALSDRIGGHTIVVVGLFLQASGLAWFAVVAKVGVTYGSEVPALILGGVGMSMFYAPIVNVLMGSVTVGEQGAASGANNALRELGGALGIAVLSAVFTARGGLGTPALFARGLVAALWVGAGAIALGGFAMLLVRSPRPEAGAVPEDAAAPDIAVPDRAVPELAPEIAVPEIGVRELPVQPQRVTVRV